MPPVLLRAMERCESGAARGALVAFRDLWPALESLGVDRTAGESAILALCQSGAMCLHAADRLGMSADELAAGIELNGEWHIGCAIRQG